ncbi:MAG: group II truncated hemoglobin [Planctomycetes bacterium]|nr:group II truncated hemoglobin [Planctomycetota bacterium]MCB9891599.1 group II truncated hemoglobin [Planctomycetota bacterium]MCB9917904.1 group II truncated hemoglobin [Planctomycetota bacterium]
MDSIYEALGGDEGVRRLVDVFYDTMDVEPVAAEIRAMHPAVLESSRDKLYWFLSGWTGGPQLYVERFGHPRLRMRHLPFAIGDAEAKAWMHCMRHALAVCVEDPGLREHLEGNFAGLAAHMRNQQGLSPSRPEGEA